MVACGKGGIDRYDGFGAFVGLVVFTALGALEDFGTTAGGEAWIFSACAGLGAANLVSTVLRWRAGEGLPVRDAVETTPQWSALTAAMTAAAAGAVWGIAAGPSWLAPLSVFVFVGAWISRARIRLAQARQRRHAQHDGT